MMGGRLLPDYTPEGDGYQRNSNGAGVESMSAKWEEMFEVKEEIVEEVKVKKPRKKAVVQKKPTAPKTSGKKSTSKKMKANQKTPKSK